MFSNLFICTVGIKITNGIRIKVLGVYRRPSGNDSLFPNFLRDNIIASLNSTENFIAGEDINIELFGDTNAVNLFMNVLYSGSFLPLITLHIHLTIPVVP